MPAGLERRRGKQPAEYDHGGEFTGHKTLQLSFFFEHAKDGSISIVDILAGGVGEGSLGEEGIFRRIEASRVGGSFLLDRRLCSLLRG